MNNSNLTFRVSTGLKDIIGKDLITDDNIAIFELVKNSYDANAKNVIITFEDNKIILADDGKGMNLQDLKRKWLFVAYSAKKDETEEIERLENEEQDELLKTHSYRDVIQEKRFYAGAKGIGRFSCDRLGESLVLKSKTQSDTIGHQIKVNWKLFEENQYEDFIKVQIPYRVLNANELIFPNLHTNGTILEISNTRIVWDANRIRNLKHSLEKLINPFSENVDFNIEIICQKYKVWDEQNQDENGNPVIERDKINGKIQNSILDILKLKTTQIEIEIDQEKINTKLIDRDTLIYHITEPNIFSENITNLKINLYYLNRSAKVNFGKKMGIQPVQYGSIFLFKNGFKVQPYGNPGNDSWGLDYRSQQGYNRFLSTRDLFGRVDIITENTEQFKEVSSRDGGLVETQGYQDLVKSFKDKALLRLERYVVGVLWGEAFIKKRYFKEDSEGLKLRKQLIETDKDNEDYSSVKSNVGSKLDFIKLIKSLSNDKNIEIKEFNQELVNLVNDNLLDLEPKFLSDLQNIANKVGNDELTEKVELTEKNFEILQREKEEAEKRSEEDRIQREEADRLLKLAEEKRINEEQRRIIAEKETEAKNKALIEAENKRLHAENEKLKAENEAKLRGQQIQQIKASETIEYKDLRDSNHIIGVYSDDITKKIQLFKRKIDRSGNIDKDTVLNFLLGISLANEKIATITRFTTKSNYLQATLETNEDLVSYIEKYIKSIYSVVNTDIKLEVLTNGCSLIQSFHPIELCVVLDNILSNSRKKNASKAILEFSETAENLILSIKDIGNAISDEIKTPSLMFEEGITTSKGAGLGLSHVKRVLENEFKASISFNKDYKKGFELIIQFPK
jgi:hypothetical protein